MLKRFLLFGGMRYYPGKGWEDFRGSFDSVEEARFATFQVGNEVNWYQVVDTEVVENTKIVLFEEREY